MTIDEVYQIFTPDIDYVCLLDEAILRNTQNLCFWARNKKKIV